MLTAKNPSGFIVVYLDRILRARELLSLRGQLLGQAEQAKRIENVIFIKIDNQYLVGVLACARLRSKVWLAARVAHRPRTRGCADPFSRKLRSIPREKHAILGS